MSLVRLSDAVVPTVFNTYVTEDTLYKSVIMNSGAVRQDADLSSKLAGGGRTYNVPFWKDLDDEEATTASDDPDDYITPGKLTSGTDVAARHVRTKAWSSADLVSELAGSDPAARIRARVGEYWARQHDMFAVATVRGVIASNIANNSGDMVSDIGNDANSTPGASELFSAEAVMDAAQTMGDEKQKLTTLVMHSVVHTRLAKLDLIDFRPDSEGKAWHPYYMDYRVIVTDNVPAIAGTYRTKYHSYLLGPNVFGWGSSDVDMPVEVSREALAGGGMGIETLVTRKQFAFHPYGVKWNGAAQAAEFPTNAELRTASNWTRVYSNRKFIPLVALITNG